MSTKSLSSPLILEPGAGVGAEWGPDQTPPTGLGVGEVGESPITTATIPGLATNSILFCFLFIKKLREGQINDSSLEKYLSLPFLPATASSLSLALLLELQRNKDSGRYADLGVEVPGHRSKP